MEQVVVSVELVTKEVVRVQGKVEREARLVVGVITTAWVAIQPTRRKVSGAE